MQKMMPPWKNQLTDQQIWDTVAYAWSLQTTREQRSTRARRYTTRIAPRATARTARRPGWRARPDRFCRTSQASPRHGPRSSARARARCRVCGKTERRGAASRRHICPDAVARGPLFRGRSTAGTGVISGTVTNKTTGKPMARPHRELGIFDQTSQLEVKTAKTDAEASTGSTSCRPTPRFFRGSDHVSRERSVQLGVRQSSTGGKADGEPARQCLRADDGAAGIEPSVCTTSWSLTRGGRWWPS